MPSSAETRRTSSITARCSSCVPWEKFKRTTLTPDRKSWRIIAGSRDAGPIVATILVRFLASGVTSATFVALTRPVPAPEIMSRPQCRRWAGSPAAPGTNPASTKCRALYRLLCVRSHRSACERLAEALCEAGSYCVHCRLRARGDVEFAEDAADVVLDGFFGQLQLRADLFIGEAGGDEPQDIRLT